MNLRSAIEGRADVRRFDLKAPSWRKIVRAMDAARFAPSAGNHFAVRFILVSDDAVISELAAASQQSFVGKAKSVVVVVSDDAGLVRSYGKRGYRYCSQHAGAVIENFLLALEAEKLVTSWVWHFVEDQVKRVLDVPDNVKVEAIFPIGIKPKIVKAENKGVRLENILFFGKYGEKKMVPSVKLSREAL